MTQYMLLIYSDRSALAQMSEEDQAADMKRWFDYSDWLAQKGWIRAGDALHGTEQATSVRHPGGPTARRQGRHRQTRQDHVCVNQRPLCGFVSGGFIAKHKSGNEQVTFAEFIKTPCVICWKFVSQQMTDAEAKASLHAARPEFGHACDAPNSANAWECGRARHRRSDRRWIWCTCAT